MALFSLIAKLGMDTSGFELGAKRAKATAGNLAKDVTGALKGGILGAVGVGALTAMTKATIEYASALGDTAERLGITTDALQDFNLAAVTNGTTMEKMTDFLERLNVSRIEAISGNEKLAESFRELGFSMEQLRTKQTENLGFQLGANIRGRSASSIINPLREVGGRGAGAVIPALRGLDEASTASRAEPGAFQPLAPDEIQKLKFLGDAASALWIKSKNLFARGVILATGMGGAVPSLPKPEDIPNVIKPRPQENHPAFREESERVSFNPALSSRQAIGAFIGVGPQMVEIKKQVKLLEKIEQNTRPTDSAGMLPA